MDVKTTELRSATAAALEHVSRAEPALDPPFCGRMRIGPNGVQVAAMNSHTWVTVAVDGENKPTRATEVVVDLRALSDVLDHTESADLELSIQARTGALVGNGDTAFRLAVIDRGVVPLAPASAWLKSRK